MIIIYKDNNILIIIIISWFEIGEFIEHLIDFGVGLLEFFVLKFVGVRIQLRQMGVQFFEVNLVVAFYHFVALPHILFAQTPQFKPHLASLYENAILHQFADAL